MFSPDIDECAMNVSLCGQNCENTFGSYECNCDPGFQLLEDSFTCEGKHIIFSITLHSGAIPTLWLLVLCSLCFCANGNLLWLPLTCFLPHSCKCTPGDG